MSSRTKRGICFCLIFSKKQQMLRCAQHDSCLGECPPKGGRYELRKLHLLRCHLGQNGQAVLDLEAFNLSVPEFLAKAHKGYPRGMDTLPSCPSPGSSRYPVPRRFPTFENPFPLAISKNPVVS